MSSKIWWMAFEAIYFALQSQISTKCPNHKTIWDNFQQGVKEDLKDLEQTSNDTIAGNGRVLKFYVFIVWLYLFLKIYKKSITHYLQNSWSKQKIRSQFQLLFPKENKMKRVKLFLFCKLFSIGLSGKRPQKELNDSEREFCQSKKLKGNVKGVEMKEGVLRLQGSSNLEYPP